MEDIDKERLIEWTIDGFRRIFVHYGIWFNEAVHQLGLHKALEMEDAVGRKCLAIDMKRLGEILGFDVDDAGIPAILKRLSRQELLELLEALGVNWLANDGVWFQEIEQGEELFTAKRCNDTCWTRFSPYEAHGIKRLCHLPEEGGLPALKQALSYRMYSRINEQSVDETDDHVLIFKMLNCRVQSARKRRGLVDYPCKSAGVVEYTTFAKTIDKRIITECIACPPDEHPDEWFCAWRFTIHE